jgi:hypothetical protein
MNFGLLRVTRPRRGSGYDYREAWNERTRGGHWERINTEIRELLSERAMTAGRKNAEGAMSEKSPRTKVIPVLRLSMRALRPCGDHCGRPGVGKRARLTRNEAAGCTMLTARELKMEIPLGDPALPDFETACRQKGTSTVGGSIFGQILRRKHVPTHFAPGSDRGSAVRWH